MRLIEGVSPEESGAMVVMEGGTTLQRTNNPVQADLDGALFRLSRPEGYAFA